MEISRSGSGAQGHIVHSDSKKLYEWQNRLLPWMVFLPTILIAVFIYLAAHNLNSLTQGVNNYKGSDLDSMFSRAESVSIKFPDGVNKDEFIRLYMLAKMDEQLMNKRYSQGGALLTARLYTKFLGFITGMILAIVGAVFIISKLSENTSNIDTSISALKFSIVSASPGIIFGVLGTILMLTAIMNQNNIKIEDPATFLTSGMYPANKVVIQTEPTDTSATARMEASAPYQQNSKDTSVEARMENSSPYK